MSIFPKRTLTGNTVTIHWNFNTSRLKDTYIMPFVKIGVRDPAGNISILFENHILGLPNPIENSFESMPQLKYLNKDLPLMVLADYLANANKRENMVEILKNIQSGKHFYFHYKVPENASLGKYTLISEVHNAGSVKYSTTIDDDYFYVEKIDIIKLVQNGNGVEVSLHNPSAEPIPLKLISYDILESEIKDSYIKVFEMKPNNEMCIDLPYPINILSYNEERVLIPLSHNTEYLVRNQEISEISDDSGRTYLFRKDAEEAYELTHDTQDLWIKADGLFAKSSLNPDELKCLDEMIQEDLIRIISY